MIKYYERYKKGFLELFFLKILSEEDLYGYELADLVNKLSDNIITISGYTSALKAPVRCFGNHLSGKRKSWFRTDNECGGAAILKTRTSRMGTPVGC